MAIRDYLDRSQVHRSVGCEAGHVRHEPIAHPPVCGHRKVLHLVEVDEVGPHTTNIVGRSFIEILVAKVLAELERLNLEKNASP